MTTQAVRDRVKAMMKGERDLWVHLLLVMARRAYALEPLEVEVELDWGQTKRVTATLAFPIFDQDAMALWLILKRNKLVEAAGEYEGYLWAAEVGQ